MYANKIPTVLWKNMAGFNKICDSIGLCEMHLKYPVNFVFRKHDTNSGTRNMG